MTTFPFSGSELIGLVGLNIRIQINTPIEGSTKECVMQAYPRFDTSRPSGRRDWPTMPILVPYSSQIL